MGQEQVPEPEPEDTAPEGQSSPQDVLGVPKEPDVQGEQSEALGTYTTVVEHTVRAQLSEQQREILAFEKKFFKYAGVKERAIATELGLTPIQYYQQVNALLNNPAAYAAEPALIARLRGLREQRGRRTLL